MKGPQPSLQLQPSQQLTHSLGTELQKLQGSDWWPLLEGWRRSKAGSALVAAVDARVAAGAVVYPAAVFRALELTPLAQVRVLILGQDPYHGAGQAEGLAFSVRDGQACPPSLRNIFKELQRDLGLPPPAKGANSLRRWAQQGVLLLNTSLTVEDGLPGSHAKLGWQALTVAIVENLRGLDRGLVFMLWGAHAQARWPGGTTGKLGEGHHLVLRSNHPSPLSALRPPVPFIGCGHFGLANQWLQQQGEAPIVW